MGHISCIEPNFRLIGGLIAWNAWITTDRSLLQTNMTNFETDLDQLENSVNGHGTHIGRLACLVDSELISEKTCAVFYRGWYCNTDANPLIVGVGSGNIWEGSNALRPDLKRLIGCVDVCPGCSLYVYGRADQTGGSSGPYSGSGQSVSTGYDSFRCTC